MKDDLLARYDRPVPSYTSYPTAPQFHAGIDAAVYRRWLGELAPEAILSLYLHVPFCRRLCWYCGCHTTVARRREPVAEYLSLLLAELDLVSDALGTRHAVGHVHFGGGTPTILAPDDLLRLGLRLRRSFDVRPDAEIAVEIDPRELDEATVAALPFSQACENNREPILAVLREAFADRTAVLEIGAGTGQHATAFAPAMPWLRWQPCIGCWIPHRRRLSLRDSPDCNDASRNY